MNETNTEWDEVKNTKRNESIEIEIKIICNSKLNLKKVWEGAETIQNIERTDTRNYKSYIWDFYKVDQIR